VASQNIHSGVNVAVLVRFPFGGAVSSFRLPACQGCAVTSVVSTPFFNHTFVFIVFMGQTPLRPSVLEPQSSCMEDVQDAPAGLAIEGEVSAAQAPQNQQSRRGVQMFSPVFRHYPHCVCPTCKSVWIRVSDLLCRLGQDVGDHQGCPPAETRHQQVYRL